MNKSLYGLFISSSAQIRTDDKPKQPFIYIIFLFLNDFYSHWNFAFSKSAVVESVHFYTFCVGKLGVLLFDCKNENPAIKRE